MNQIQKIAHSNEIIPIARKLYLEIVQTARDKLSKCSILTKDLSLSCFKHNLAAMLPPHPNLASEICHRGQIQSLAELFNMRSIFSNLAVMNKFFGSDRPQNTFDRVDTDTFRNVMREVASHVSVIAAGPHGNRNGLTATAVCPVSDEPPTLLVCVKRSAQAHDTIVQSESFSINFLSAEQKDIAVNFSGVKDVHGEDRFAIGQWGTNLTGAPLLEDTVCSLECQLVDHRSVATHTIFFGELVGGYLRNDASALLYLQGSYRSLGPITLTHNS